MANDTEARSRITLLGQGSTQVVYGNLLSLPYGGGLLYVQPVYLKSTNVANPYPLMKLVLVSYGTTVAFGDTLDIAIQNLVKKAGGTPSTGQPPPDQGQQNPPPSTTVSSELLAAAQKLDAAITKVQQAQAAGDFAAYGQALGELQTAMNEFKAAQAKASSAPPASPSPSPSR